MPKEAPNPCCREEHNLGVPITPNPEKPEFTYRICVVCRARHFILYAEPGEIGLMGTFLGKQAN